MNFKTIRELSIKDCEAPVAYIAGKVTGLDYDTEVYPVFTKVAEGLAKDGFFVLNPIELVHRDAEWEEAMKICLHFLPHADVLMLLPNWEQSKGATMERDIAMRLGIKIVYARFYEK